MMKFLPILLSMGFVQGQETVNKKAILSLKEMLQKANPMQLMEAAPRDDLIWTDTDDMTEYLPEIAKDSKNKAFRDIFGEITVRKIFAFYMKKVKYPMIFGRQLLRDPLKIRKGIHFTRKEDLFDIDMRTKHMAALGLGNLKLDYIRVVRHLGLQDVKVNLMVDAGDLQIVGQYELDGSAIGFLKLSGNGEFSITVKNTQVLASSYAVAKPQDDGKDKDQKMVIKELDIQFIYDKVEFDFQNLMGGGVVGSTVNLVINAMGEAIIESQKQEMIKYLRYKFKSLISNIL